MLLEELGFAVKGYRMEYHDLSEASERYGPLLVHLSEGAGHFVLFLGDVAAGPVVGDPSEGCSIWPAHAFLDAWSGVALAVVHLHRGLDYGSVSAARRSAEERVNVLAAWSLR